MPHADASLVPASIRTKADFWLHVHSQLEALLAGQRHWVSNLANASSLIFNSVQSFPSHFGSHKTVNWCGFYIHSQYFPHPVRIRADKMEEEKLLLGPFCGKPACQFIEVEKGKARGVCADGFVQRKTVIVPNVELYPGHIGCDGETKSEIVCPLIFTRDYDVVVLGVLDLDCLGEDGFDDDDRVGLESIAALIVGACDWYNAMDTA